MSYMPSQIVLMDETITTAQTATTKTVVTGFARAKGVTIQCNFTYGAGGTTAKVWVQTSFDGGATWVDIANFAHTTASLRRLFSLDSTGSVGTIVTATDGTLADDTSENDLIGDQLRVKFTSTGTYSGDTTVRVDVTAKE